MEFGDLGQKIFPAMLLVKVKELLEKFEPVQHHNMEETSAQGPTRPKLLWWIGLS